MGFWPLQVTEFVVLKLQKCSLGRAGDSTLPLDSISSLQRMDQTHLCAVFYPQLMAWKGDKAVTLERMPSFQYEVKYGLYSKNLVYYDEFWSALTFINDNMFQKIRLSVVPVFLLEEQPHTLSQVLKSNLRGSGEGRETLSGASRHRQTALCLTCRSVCRSYYPLYTSCEAFWVESAVEAWLSCEVSSGRQLWTLFCLVLSVCGD